MELYPRARAVRGGFNRSGVQPPLSLAVATADTEGTPPSGCLAAPGASAVLLHKVATCATADEPVVSGPCAAPSVATTTTCASVSVQTTHVLAGVPSAQPTATAHIDAAAECEGAGRIAPQARARARRLPECTLQPRIDCGYTAEEPSIRALSPSPSSSPSPEGASASEASSHAPAASASASLSVFAPQASVSAPAQPTLVPALSASPTQVTPLPASEVPVPSPSAPASHSPPPLLRGRSHARVLAELATASPSVHAGALPSPPAPAQQQAAVMVSATTSPSPPQSTKPDAMAAGTGGSVPGAPPGAVARHCAIGAGGGIAGDDVSGDDGSDDSRDNGSSTVSCTTRTSIRAEHRCGSTSDHPHVCSTCTFMRCLVALFVHDRLSVDQLPVFAVAVSHANRLYVRRSTRGYLVVGGSPCLTGLP